MQVISPLTDRDNIKLIETLATKQIKKLYQDKIGLLKVVETDFENVDEIGFYECCDSGLKFFYPCVTASSEYYDRLNDGDKSYYPDEKDEYRYASKFIKSDDVVLEIGAGKGVFCQYIKPKNYLGLEFSDSAIEIASKGGIKLKKETIEQHASHAENRGKYSTIVAFQVLEHIARPTSFIKTALECLDEGGQLIIAVPSEDGFFSTRVNDTLNIPPHHVTRWTDRALKFLGEKFDLDVIGIHHEKVDDTHKPLFLYCLCLLPSLKLFGTKKKLVDTSVRFSLASKLSSLISKFLLQGFEDPGLMPYGHSVTVVYRKRISTNKFEN